jgi:hypothetical protein
MGFSEEFALIKVGPSTSPSSYRRMSAAAEATESIAHSSARPDFKPSPAALSRFSTSSAQLCWGIVRMGLVGLLSLLDGAAQHIAGAVDPFLGGWQDYERGRDAQKANSGIAARAKCGFALAPGGRV